MKMLIDVIDENRQPGGRIEKQWNDGIDSGFIQTRDNKDGRIDKWQIKSDRKKPRSSEEIGQDNGEGFQYLLWAYMKRCNWRFSIRRSISVTPNLFLYIIFCQNCLCFLCNQMEEGTGDPGRRKFTAKEKGKEILYEQPSKEKQDRFPR